MADLRRGRVVGEVQLQEVPLAGARRGAAARAGAVGAQAGGLGARAARPRAHAVGACGPLLRDVRHGRLQLVLAADTKYVKIMNIVTVILMLMYSATRT